MALSDLLDLGIDFVKDNPAETIAGLSTLGGIYTNQQAAEAAANAATQSAQIAADAAQFKPYSVATGLGTSFFDTANQTAGYEIDPALQAFRDDYLQGASQLFPTNLSASPQSLANTYYSQLKSMGGTPATIANRYASMAGRVSTPTDLQSYYNNISAPSSLALNNAYSGMRAPSYTNVGGTYDRLRAPSYSNTAQGIANQYTQAGANLLGQGTANAGDLYDQIRELQRPEEERQRGAMEQGLFGSGRLGMRSAQYGGTPEQLAFEKALGESRNQAAYQAINQADALRASQLAQAQGLSGMGLSASQQADALRQLGYQDQTSLLSNQLAARQAQNQLSTQAFNNQLGLRDRSLAALQAENARRQQAFTDQMSLAEGRLGAAESQADLYNALQSNALSAYGNQIQNALGMRTGALSEMDQAIARATGMFNTGMGIEQLGLTPLELGAQLGGYNTQAGAAASNALLQGGMNAAQANLAGSLGTSKLFGDFGLGLLGLGNGE